MISWKPNIYFNKGVGLNYSENYLAECIKYGDNLNSNNLPVIFSLKHLSEILNVSYGYLNDIVNREANYYKDFLIKKKSGGYRKIIAPEPILLLVLRFIHQHILANCHYHSSSKAYLKGHSILNNASIHCGSKWLIKIDIRRFFESISEKQIYYCFNQMGYPPKLSFELARITTIVTPQSIQYGQKRWKNEDVFIGYLPQGFPTSPLLANKVCYHLDELLSQIAKDHRCSYTRYSDDIVFSTNFCNRNVAKIIIKRTNNVLASFGFRPNHRKTSIVPPGARKIVTGLVVNTDEPKLKRELKDQIRSHLYYAKKYGITNHCKKVGFNSLVGFKNHLEGLINYAKSIDKNLGNKYLNEFNKINWF